MKQADCRHGEVERYCGLCRGDVPLPGMPTATATDRVLPCAVGSLTQWGAWLLKTRRPIEDIPLPFDEESEV